MTSVIRKAPARSYSSRSNRTPSLPIGRLRAALRAGNAGMRSIQLAEHLLNDPAQFIRRAAPAAAARTRRVRLPNWRRENPGSKKVVANIGPCLLKHLQLFAREIHIHLCVTASGASGDSRAE